ncbi:hypothetical protein THOM_1510, partial [Trachipleistophora hominis]
MRKIKKICNFSHDTWDTAVHLAIDAYNKSFHRAVGCSPFELLHKETPLFSVDAGLVSDKYSPRISGHVLEARRTSILKSYAKEFEGSVTAQNTFAEGDKVLRYNFSPLLNKLDPHWVSGYTVKRVKQGSEALTVEKNGT